MVRQWQEAFYGERYSSSNMETGMPDFVKLADAFGVKGMVIRSRNELKDAVAAMLAHDGPFVLDARVKRDENCYPMVAPGKSNAQMFGLPERKNLEKMTEVIVCSNCGAKNMSTHKFCPECGAKL
jgi:acetolactate synthase-1/2/3 large subunit